MILSPYVETREIFLPSLDIVYGHSGAGASTTCDDHCVSVRDSAGIAIINNVNIGIAVINLIITSLHFNTYLPCLIFELEAWLLGSVRFDQSCCALAVSTSYEVSANA